MIRDEFSKSTRNFIPVRVKTKNPRSRFRTLVVVNDVILSVAARSMSAQKNTLRAYLTVGRFVEIRTRFPRVLFARETNALTGR